MGSKSKIAEKIVDLLPSSHTLVDLFAGGCALTHCALLSGKFQKIIVNDITDGPDVFVNAFNGLYKGFSFVPSREEFHSSDDTFLKIIYSYANDRNTYLWSKERESLRVMIGDVLCSNTAHERYLKFRKLWRFLSEYVSMNNSLPFWDRMESAEAMERICAIGATSETLGVSHKELLSRLSLSRKDYRLVRIPEGATVYADPPYKEARKESYYKFDYASFEEWMNSVSFPVFVSDFVCPNGCAQIAEFGYKGAIKIIDEEKRLKHSEKLFVQKKFVDFLGELT